MAITTVILWQYVSCTLCCDLILVHLKVNLFIFVRHVTGTGSGLLEEIPRSGIQISASTKKATIGVRAPYATRRKLRYEANQVWMNTTFISQGPQSSGFFAVET